jgi:hypothetical protein
MRSRKVKRSRRVILRGGDNFKSIVEKEIKNNPIKFGSYTKSELSRYIKNRVKELKIQADIKKQALNKRKKKNSNKKAPKKNTLGSKLTSFFGI